MMVVGHATLCPTYATYLDSELELVLAKQIAAVNLVGHVTDVVGNTVGNDDVGLFFELRQVIHHSGAEKLRFLERGFINNDLDALGLCAS